MWTATSWASCGVAAGHLDEHAVDAAAALDVQVAVEHVAGAGLEPHDAAELDLLLERDLEVVEASWRSATAASPLAATRRPAPGPPA